MLEYSESGREVIGVNPKEKEIEGIFCVPTLEEILQTPGSSKIGVSVVTPPAVSLAVLQEIEKSNLTNRVKFWFQPGSYNDEVITKCQDILKAEDFVIGPCVLVELPQYPKL